MVKLHVPGESKEDKFKRIATTRTQRILEDLRLLENCSNTHTYSYNPEDVSKIFSAVDQELKRIKILFNKRKKKKFEL